MAGESLLPGPRANICGEDEGGEAEEEEEEEISCTASDFSFPSPLTRLLPPPPPSSPPASPLPGRVGVAVGVEAEPAEGLTLAGVAASSKP